MTSTRPSRPSAAPAAETLPSGMVAGQYPHDGYTVVWAIGEIDIATAKGLMQELAIAVHSQHFRVIVDLTDVTFMDSTGLNALVLARRKANAGGGEVRLVAASARIRKILHITGLEQVFPVHSTIEESISQGPGVRTIATPVRFPGQVGFRE